MKRTEAVTILLIGILLLIAIPDLSADSTLIAILERVGEMRAEERLPLVIFDLDGTLFYTGFRSRQIFLEYAQEQGDTVLEKKIHSINPRTMKYRVRRSLIESGVTDSTLLKSLIDAWRLKFFSDTYLDFDEPLPGSVDFVNALHDSGALIIYLTGRDAPGMAIGTATSLKNHGFPFGVERTELIMKPEKYEKTIRFKEQAIGYIERLGTVAAIFENEPENMNLLIEWFPHATACFLETQHKPHAPPVTETAHHLKHFRINHPLKPTGNHREKTE